jgi:hypothetical protein
MPMVDLQLSQSLASVAEYTRDCRQFTMTMLHLISSKEPNIKLSIDSNTSIAAKTFGNQACSNFTISDVNMSKQRRIKSNDTHRASIQATEHNGDASRQINQTHSCECTQI